MRELVCGNVAAARQVVPAHDGATRYVAVTSHTRVVADLDHAEVAPTLDSAMRSEFIPLRTRSHSELPLLDVSSSESAVVYGANLSVDVPDGQHAPRVAKELLLVRVADVATIVLSKR